MSMLAWLLLGGIQQSDKKPRATGEGKQSPMAARVQLCQRLKCTQRLRTPRCVKTQSLGPVQDQERANRILEPTEPQVELPTDSTQGDNRCCGPAEAGAYVEVRSRSSSCPGSCRSLLFVPPEQIAGLGIHKHSSSFPAHFRSPWRKRLEHKRSNSKFA